MSDMSTLFKEADNVNKSRTNQIEMWDSIYRAKCVENKDPSKQGRVRVWIPELMEGTVNDDKGVWVRPAPHTYSGNAETGSDGVDDCGSLTVPPIGAYVYVFFEMSDPNKGCYFCGATVKDSIPTECQAGGNWYKKDVLCKRPTGRVVMVSDDDSLDAGVVIRSKDRSKGKRTVKGTPLRTDSMQIVIQENANGKYIRLNDGSGNFILIDEAATVIQLHINTGTDVKLSPKGLDINVSGNCNITSSGTTKINASKIFLN